MSNNNINSRKARALRKKKRRNRRILISILSILLFVLVAAATYFITILNSVEKVEIKQDHVSVGIDKTLEFDDSITNIAFFGVDSRDGDVGRSDATMVLTIDKKHNKVKLTSLLRDSYVSIDGHNKDKLNHAYAFGGPQLAIKTINKNFGLDIKDFVKVDFGQLVDVIDALGGVEVTIKDYELNQVNQYIQDVARETKKTASSVKVGTQNLSGVQAVGYTRVRYAGNGDVERTERQRTVIDAIFNKIKTAGVSQYPKIVSKLLPLVDTSLSSKEIVSLGLSMLNNGLKDLQMTEFPLTNKAQGKTINGVWYWVFDLEDNKNLIRDYIYEDIQPQ